jgi:multidrug efflux pump subunit AcrA (membrane-fusion protein)
VEAESVRRQVRTVPVRREQVARDVRARNVAITPDADRHVTVFAPAPGRVARLLALLGEDLRRGAVLAELEGGRGARVQVRAPIAGLVLTRTLDAGQVVDRSTALFTMAPLERVWAHARVPQDDLPFLAIGQRVHAQASGLHRVHLGRVGRIDDHDDAQTQTRLVRVEIENDDRSLRPGMRANLWFSRTAAKIEVLGIPRDALIESDGGTIVLVREASGAFERRPVTIGTEDGDMVEVRSGLREGEQVAIGAPALLKSVLLKCTGGE